jgi:hypothetical protein
MNMGLYSFRQIGLCPPSTNAAMNGVDTGPINDERCQLAIKDRMAASFKIFQTSL